jgi:uncharacterized protein (TIGR03435 family)
MKRIMGTAGLAALLCGGLLAGQSGEKLQFDALSVKPVPAWDGKGMPPLPRKVGGPGSPRVTFHNCLLRDLLVQAYDIQPYQLSAPSWVMNAFYADADSFDIEATMPANTTKEQFAIMLQNALVERFNMKIHRETKTTQGYALTVGKQLKIAPVPEPIGAEPIVEPDKYVLGKDGFAVTPPGYSGLRINAAQGRMRVKFMRQSMAQFAKWMAATELKRPVVDRTGLEGRYDFILEFQFGGVKTTDSADGGTDAPSFLGAVESVLGLKLVREPCTVEMLVVDHVDRMPTAN